MHAEYTPAQKRAHCGDADADGGPGLACHWCGSAIVRYPADTAAVASLLYIGSELADSTLCSAACIYSAGMSLVPLGRPDVGDQLRRRLLRAHGAAAVYRVDSTGRRIDACEWCAAPINRPVDLLWLADERVSSLRICTNACVWRMLTVCHGPDAAESFATALEARTGEALPRQ